VLSAGDELGYPVVLKIVAEKVVHKSDVGGVRVGIADREELAAAIGTMMEQVQSRAGIQQSDIDGLLVQKMLSGGKETIIGLTDNPGFGRLLMFGLGGIYVEALHDVVFRVHPLSDLDAAEMIKSLRGARLLTGIRGEAPADREAIQDAILRISQLATDHPQIVELDINPWLAMEQGGYAVDGRISISEASD
jgi:acetate---CoA ligase (ADP-forming)